MKTQRTMGGMMAVLVLMLCWTGGAFGQLPSGAVSYWAFEEGSGGTANDSVGTNHGTITGATWTTGQVDGALQFDGDDSVQISDAPDLDVTSGVTVEAWVNPSAYRNYDVIVRKPWAVASAPWSLWGLGFTNDTPARPHFDVASGGVGCGITAVSIAPLDLWTHIVGTYDGGTAIIYVNGAEEASNAAGSGPIDTNDMDVYIGYHNFFGASESFEGRIDEVVVYNRALTPEEVWERYQDGLTRVPTGQVAHWSLDEGADSTAHDSINSHDGTVVGASWDAGLFGGALNFNGTSDYVDVASALGHFSEYSVSFWRKSLGSGTGGSPRMVTAWKTDPYVFNDDVVTLEHLANNQNTISCWMSPDAENKQPGTAPVAQSHWDHVTATFDGSFGRLYLNGTEAGNTTFTPGSLVTFNFVQIGGHASTSRYFNGLLDEVIIYDRALSDSEVLQQYLEGASCFPSVPVAYWDFEEGADSTAHDVVGGHDGTVYGATWATGAVGGALDFDGSNDYVDVTSALGTINDFTVEFWRKATGTGSGLCPRMVSAWRTGVNNGSDDGFVIEHTGTDQNTLTAWMSPDGVNQQVGSASVVQDQWYHVALTFDGVVGTLYVNGNEKGSYTYPVGVTMDINFVQIGGDTNLGRYFNGLLDEVKIHDRALAWPEIQQLYWNGVDESSPSAGTAVAPATGTSSPITVTYSGASDSGPSGLSQVELWFKKGAGGTWTDSGSTDTGESGSFNFTGMTGDDTYYFDLVAEDNAENRSGAASGDGDSHTVYDTTGPTAPVMDAEPAWTSGTENTVSWGAAGDAVSYDVECDDADDFLSLVDSATVSTPPLEHTFSSLSDGVTYWYRVRGEDSLGNPGGWSSTVFSTQNTVALEAELEGSASVGAVVGGSVTFQVNASGANGTVHYQWYMVDTSKTDIPVGEDSPTYTIDPVTLEAAGDYYCEITDDAETVTSATFTLTVSEGLPAVTLSALLALTTLTALVGAMILRRRRAL